MSSYINFFIRIDDKFLPLSDFSRSSEIYQRLYNNVPYEKLRALTYNELDSIEDDIIEDKRKYTDLISEYKKEIELIATFNNSAEEKLEAINSTESMIKDIEESISELNYAQGWFNSLCRIIDSASDYTDENYNHLIDADKYIYAGVETPCVPTLKDVENEEVKV